VIGDEHHLAQLQQALAGTGTEASAGEQAIVEAAGSGAEWTMAAIVGTAGLKPAMRALKGAAPSRWRTRRRWFPPASR
jgi:1-deoxy-D-xylulose-5-phosphate reductoisomerase